MTVDKTGVDETVVDVTGVDKLGINQRSQRNLIFYLSHSELLQKSEGYK